MSSVHVDTIPLELRDRPQWVTWTYLDGQKVPFDARTGKAASSSDPATWSSFDDACRASRQRHHAGIGYVFAPDDPFVGIDLDDCIDADGHLADWARAIVDTMATYTEVSPSGTGVKLWVIGSIPGSVKTAQIEIYAARRYFTVTGQRLPDTPAAIRAADDELAKLYASLRPAPSTAPSLLPEVPPDAGYVRQWCLAAIAGERQKMLAAGDGERHNRRFASAFALGGLIHTGALTEQEIFDALDVNHGPNVATARKTMWDGIAAGMEHPREISPPHTSGTPGESSGEDDLDALDADQLRDRVRVVTAERDLWRRKYERLDEWRAWATSVARLETENLSPAAKVAAFTLWPELESRKEHGITAPAPIWIEEAATRAGLSPGTYGKKLKELAAVGAIVRQETKDPVTGHSKVLIAPAAFEQPDAWAPPEPRNHGGERADADRPAPSCATCGPDAPVVQERTVVTRMLCGTCETELAEHTFTQERTTIWPTNHQVNGWSNEVDAETPNQHDARAGEDPNHQRAGQEDHPSAVVPQVAGWDALAAAEGTGTDPAAHPDPGGVPSAGASLLDDVANLPGVRAGLIAPDDPSFAYLRAIAAGAVPDMPPTDGGPSQWWLGPTDCLDATMIQKTLRSPADHPGTSIRRHRYPTGQRHRASLVP